MRRIIGTVSALALAFAACSTGHRFGDSDRRCGCRHSVHARRTHAHGGHGRQCRLISAPRGKLTTTHRFGVGTQTAVAGGGRTCTTGGITLTAGSTANGVPANGQLVTISSNVPLCSLLATLYASGKVHFGSPNLGRALRQRAAHAGPIDEATLVYRIEFHTL